MQGLVSLMGGKSRFISKLDSVFTRPPKFSLYDRSFNEIAEMHQAGFGQYAHGNQPAQHLPYLYTYVGEAWKLNIGFGKLWIVCIIQLLMVIAAMRIMDRHPLGICLVP